MRLIEPNKVSKLLDAISVESASVHQLALKTGFDRRSVNRYVDLIIEVQNAVKIEKTREGLRTMVRKEEAK